MSCLYGVVSIECRYRGGETVKFFKITLQALALLLIVGCSTRVGNVLRPSSAGSDTNKQDPKNKDEVERDLYLIATIDIEALDASITTTMMDRSNQKPVELGDGESLEWKWDSPVTPTTSEGCDSSSCKLIFRGDIITTEQISEIVMSATLISKGEDPVKVENEVSSILIPEDTENDNTSAQQGYNFINYNGAKWMLGNPGETCAAACIRAESTFDPNGLSNILPLDNSVSVAQCGGLIEQLTLLGLPEPDFSSLTIGSDVTNTPAAACGYRGTAVHGYRGTAVSADFPPEPDASLFCSCQ